MGTQQDLLVEEKVLLYIPPLMPRISERFIDKIEPNFFEYWHPELSLERELLQRHNPSLELLMYGIRNILEGTKYQKKVSLLTSLTIHRALRKQAEENRLEWILGQNTAPDKFSRDQHYILPLVTDQEVRDLIDEIQLADRDQRRDYTAKEVEWLGQHDDCVQVINLLNKLKECTKPDTFNDDFSEAVTLSGIALVRCLLNKAISNYILLVYPQKDS